MEGSTSELCLQAECSAQATGDCSSDIATAGAESTQQPPDPPTTTHETESPHDSASQQVDSAADMQDPSTSSPAQTAAGSAAASPDAQGDLPAVDTMSNDSNAQEANSGLAAANAVAALAAAAAAEAAATPAQDTAGAAASANTAQQQAPPATTAPSANAQSTRNATAQPGTNSSPIQSSSGSLSSRRSSRTRVGEPAAAVAPPPVLPLQPAAQQHTQQQQPLLQQQSLSRDSGIQPLLTAPASVAAGPSSATGPQSCAEAMSYTVSAGPECEPSQPCGMLAPSYHKSTSSSILSLHIHGTSQLVPDVLLTDPVLRLHVVHAATGEYVRIMQQLDSAEAQQQQQVQQQQQQQQVQQQQEQREQQEQQQGPATGGSSPSRLMGGSSSLPRTQHPVSNDVQAELLDYLGRPTLSTLDNNTQNPKSGLLEYIPAVQTRPFDVTTSSSSGSSAEAGGCDGSTGSSGSNGGSGSSSRLGLSASWDEELCVDAAPEQLVEADALLLLELLQLPGGFTRYKRHAGEFGKAGGGHSIAWAFLRMSGLQHRQLLSGHQPLKLRLQLYQYSPGTLKPKGLMSPWLAAPHPVSPAKGAYLSFKLSGSLSVPHSTAAGAAAAAAAAVQTTLKAPGSPIRGSIKGLGSPQVGQVQSSTAAVGLAGSSGSNGGRRGSSLLSVGMWTPWGPEGLSMPGFQDWLPSQGLAAAGVSKYPGYVEVTLAAVPRPQGAVVVTDPAASIRPALPAGYGSGFEIGRMPFSLLYMPKAMRGTMGSAGGLYSTAGGAGGGRLSAEDAGGPVADAALLLLESRLHRPHTHPCQVPNDVLVEVQGTVGGCSAISISRDGRWLAAACGDDKGRFKVVLYQALTGRLCWVLGSHAGMVHSISWAKDDSALITASTDFTAKVWHLPMLPGPPLGSPQASMLRHYSGSTAGAGAVQQGQYGSSTAGAVQQHYSSSTAGALHSTAGDQALTGAAGIAGGTWLDSKASTQRAYARWSAGSSSSGMQGLGPGYTAGLGITATPSLGATAAAAGVSVSILQHTCFVYAAEMHPTFQPLPTVVTAGFDGVLRLWNMEGVVLCSLMVSVAPVNCIAFDQLGTRMFAGDASGILTEVAVDLTPVTALTAAAAAAAAAAPSWSQEVACIDAGASGSSSPVSSACGGTSAAGRCAQAAGSCEAAAVASSSSSSSGSHSGAGGAALVASMLRNGSVATQQLAGAHMLRKLRVSQEVAGCPIMSLTCHPGGHHLVALARSPKGVSDLVALDAKLLLVARRFTGIRCSIAPIKFALSPDGQYVVCGSEDGSATMWDFATATPTPMPHMALGGAPLHCMAWSSCFQAIAACSFSHYARIRVLGWAAEQQEVVLNPPDPAAQKQYGQVSESDTSGLSDLHRPLRCPLPDQLTPAHVHALLSDLRLSASQRGLYSQPTDSNRQQLMVTAQAARKLPRRLGSRPAATDSSSLPTPATTAPAAAAAAAAQTTSSGGSRPGALTMHQGLTGLQIKQQQQHQGGSADQALIPAGVNSQPGTPRVIDGPAVSGSAVAAPWQS